MTVTSCEPRMSEGMTTTLLAYATEDAPVGTLLLGLGDNGMGQFTTRTAGVIAADHAAAEAFVRSLPATSRRRVFVRTRREGGVLVHTDVWVPHHSAVVLFNRFVAHAIAKGYTPAASIVPAERRGCGQYAEVADIAEAFAPQLRGA
jgi:hypothetical protein